MGAVLLLSFPCLFTTEEAILATGSAVQVSSMGNDLSAIGGAVATVGTSIAAGVTFGQVKELNQAVVSTYQFTANKVSGSIIGNGVAAAASGIATAGTGLAAGVTLGQVDALNKATEHLARGAVHHVSFAGEETGKAAIGLMDGTPVVGHLKGAIHYAVGDTEGGDQVMRSASRTIGVIGGGVVGMAGGGPAGMVAGGALGGAAADGIITGIESSIHGEFRPSGQIETVNRLATHTGDDQALVGSIVQGLVTTSLDGLTGFSTGTKVKANLPQIKATLRAMRTNPLKTVKAKLRLVFILKLMSVRHIRAKPYFGEICSRNYPNFDLEDCTSTLHLALAKYGTDDGLEKAMEHLPHNVVIDHMIEAETCKGLGDAYPCNGADQRFNTALQDINSFIRPLGTKRRVKRQVCQTGTDILTAKYKFQERAAWKVMNKRLGPLDDIVDSHMKLADLMQDSGKWRKRMNKMLPDEIENVVMNLKKSAANARAVSAIHGPETGHAYRYNTYDIAVPNLERFQAQRAMAVPPAPPRVRPTGPTRTWGPPL